MFKRLKILGSFLPHLKDFLIDPSKAIGEVYYAVVLKRLQNAYTNPYEREAFFYQS